MIWRRLRLDGAYLAGELVIVVAGVLIALAANSWYEGRQARVEEIDALRRLAADLSTDTAMYSGLLATSVVRKRENLRRVREGLERPEAIEDDYALLTDVTGGAGLGWNQPPAARSTYDDLLESGGLGRLRNPELRELLATYYGTEVDARFRTGLRRTRYPEITYRLVPRADELTPDRSLGPEALADVVRAVVASDLASEITAELNLTGFIEAIFRASLETADSLLMAIDVELTSLGAN